MLTQLTEFDKSADSLSLFRFGENWIEAAPYFVPLPSPAFSHDDLPTSELLDPPLTVLAQPIRPMATQAAELLIRRAKGEEFAPVHQVYPLELIIRGSCGTAGHQPAPEDRSIRPIPEESPANQARLADHVPAVARAASGPRRWQKSPKFSPGSRSALNRRKSGSSVRTISFRGVRSRSSKLRRSPVVRPPT